MSAETGAPDTSLMSIGKIVEILSERYPGVTPSSLRFLEREGLIKPTRTPGGHRLYSDADVRRVSQIKMWQEQRLSLDDIRERLRQRDALPDPANLSQHFLNLMLAGDGASAATTILDADALGMPLLEVFGDVIEPALIEVGNRWQFGTVLVAQERTVTELVRDLVAELSLRHITSRPDAPGIVAACVAGERHELGLRMLVGLLRAEGYRVHYLGADVASEFIADATRLHQPAAVMLSARFPESEGALAEAVAAVRAVAPESAAILVGGRFAAECGDRVAALGAIPIASSRLTDALDTLRDVLPPLSPDRAA